MKITWQSACDISISSARQVFCLFPYFHMSRKKDWEKQLDPAFVFSIVNHVVQLLCHHYFIEPNLSQCMYSDLNQKLI